jgi:AraC family transcriptional regulator
VQDIKLSQSVGVSQNVVENPRNRSASVAHQVFHSVVIGGVSERPRPVKRPELRSNVPGSDPIVIVIATLIQRAVACGVNGDMARQCVARATTLLRADPAMRSGIVAAPPAGRGRGGLSPWHLNRVLEFVDTRLDCTIRTTDLTGLVHLSPAHFSREFKKSMGVAPSTYITAKRIERACGMMLMTDEPLASVAIACGLFDQSHFCRVFRRFVGASPNVWRRANRVPIPTCSVQAQISGNSIRVGADISA